MKRLIVFLIRVYQIYWSSWHPPVCRFNPSCSQYAIEALWRYGIWRGSFFILKRLLRCHPWCAGGYDPVP